MGCGGSSSVADSYQVEEAPVTHQELIDKGYVVSSTRDPTSQTEIDPGDLVVFSTKSYVLCNFSDVSDSSVVTSPGALRLRWHGSDAQFSAEPVSSSEHRYKAGNKKPCEGLDKAFLELRPGQEADVYVAPSLSIQQQMRPDLSANPYTLWRVKIIEVRKPGQDSPRKKGFTAEEVLKMQEARFSPRSPKTLPHKNGSGPAPLTL